MLEDIQAILKYFEHLSDTCISQIHGIRKIGFGGRGRNGKESEAVNRRDGISIAQFDWSTYNI